MPKQKNTQSQIPTTDGFELQKALILKGITGLSYFLLNYNCFTDYFKILKSISNESDLRYCDDEKTKNIVEFTAISEGSMIVVKIPLIETNVTKTFIGKLKHDITFSKYNNGLFVIIFGDDFVSTRYTYTSNTKPIELKNDKYFSLVSMNKNKSVFDNEESYEDKNEDDTSSVYSEENYAISDDDLYSEDEEESSNNILISNSNQIVPIQNSDELLSNENKEQIKNGEMISIVTRDESCAGEYSQQVYDTTPTLYFNSLTEEVTKVGPINRIYQTSDDKIIKNVICYTSIDYNQLRDIFKNLGNTRVQVSIKGDIMSFHSINAAVKKSNIEYNVVCVNPEFQNKDFHFFINSKSFFKLKSLDSNFSIMSTSNKKIFKRIEFKIVADTSDPNNYIYGITIFPSNFEETKHTYNKMHGQFFDIYNSIMIFIRSEKTIEL